VHALGRYGFKKIAANHCTGAQAIALMHELGYPILGGSGKNGSSGTDHVATETSCDFERAGQRSEDRSSALGSVATASSPTPSLRAGGSPDLLVSPTPLRRTTIPLDPAVCDLLA
jgi:hypothetical protein